MKLPCELGYFLTKYGFQENIKFDKMFFGVQIRQKISISKMYVKMQVQHAREQWTNKATEPTYNAM